MHGEECKVSEIRLSAGVGKRLAMVALLVGWSFPTIQAETSQLEAPFGASLAMCLSERTEGRFTPTERYLPGLGTVISGSGESQLLAKSFRNPTAEVGLVSSEAGEQNQQGSEPLGSTEKPGPRTLLIEPADLRKKHHEPGLRILDTRPLSEYAKSHVPGAVLVDVKNWQEQGKKEGGLHDAKAWGEKVGQLGIGHDSKVVVYGSNLTDSARIWWTLKYLGLREVAILDGGWQAWVQEKQPTEKATPKIESVTFEPKFQIDRLEEIGSLKKCVQTGKVKLLDTRSADEFTGKEVRGKRGGHIPGAKLLEWKELLATNGRFKSPEQLRELFRQRGITPDQSAVTY